LLLKGLDLICFANLGEDLLSKVLAM